MERGCAFWSASNREPMRLLVCGGRDYSDQRTLFRALDKLMTKRQVVTLIHGAATGADSLAGQWAESRGIEQIACPAEWEKHGKRRIAETICGDAVPSFVFSRMKNMESLKLLLETEILRGSI